MVDQNLLNRGPDQHGATGPLNDGGDVKGELAGASSRVVRSALVVVDQEGIDEKAGLFRGDT